MTHSSRSVTPANDLSFDAEVLREPGPVLVDFSAAWCGPCRVLAPIVEQLAAERADLKVVVVDMDESPAVCARYGVRAAPTLMVFLGGERRAQHVGLTSKAKIAAMVAGQER